MRKFLLPMLLIPWTAAATPSANLVSCQIKDPAKCTDCKTRVPASCENHQFIGHLNLDTKPSKIQWILSDSKTGTEQVIETENSKITLKDLKDLESSARSLKLKVSSNQKVSLGSVLVEAKTPFFKKPAGKDIAAVLKKQSNLRNIASAGPEPVIGGIRRAQSSKDKK